MNKHPRGSEWRKWDLHFHTPSSYDYRDKSISNEKIINGLSQNNISVVAITDHHIIDVKRITELQILGKEKNITVLPGIEFRAELGGSESIHYIGIFSETLDEQALNDIWTKLQSTCNITKTDIEKIGGDPNIQCDFKETSNLIHKLGGIVTVHAGTKSNTFENITNSLPDKMAQKRDLVKDYIDIFELGKEGDQLTYNEIVFPNLGFKLPMIICSDNHNIADYIIKQNLWIKSDSTFDGLKQIIYEPSERVRIQKTDPALDFEKPFFSNIYFKTECDVFENERDLRFSVDNDSIPLNQNMVAIIGGRGEGKSMLTDYLSSSFVGKGVFRNQVFNKNGSIVVEYQKTNKSGEESVFFSLENEKHSVDFIYINQGQLKNIVDPKEKEQSLANSIRKLAKIKDVTFNTELNIGVLSVINEIHELNDYLNEKDNEGKLVNSIDFYKDEEKSIAAFIDNITTKENKERLSQYSLLLSNTNQLRVKIEQLQRIELEIENGTNRINELITKVNEESNIIPIIDIEVFQKQKSAIAKWLESINKSIDENTLSIQEIKNNFQEFKGDLTTLLGDVDKYQNSLDVTKRKIQEINEKSDRLEYLKSKFYNNDSNDICLIDQIKNDYLNQKEFIESEWSRFKSNEDLKSNPAQADIMNQLLDKLEIEVIVQFDKNAFYNLMSETINGTYWRAKNNYKAKLDYFEINDLDTFFNYIKDETKFLKDCYNESFYRKEFTDFFLNNEWRKEYIKVFPVLKDNGKDIDKLSVGQKGTVYLRMKLATEAFSKPIIFDQPEDDLDNKFIMDDLVDLFKSIKKYRQVIIITHNANLVVNADAEQVIVAKNNEGLLSYSSGSLEDRITNDSICHILEGGRIAFEKRRDKYKYLK
jgi:ABC-type dipeptide/oligopeptide/nickel transport system ATPase component